LTATKLTGGGCVQLPVTGSFSYDNEGKPTGITYPEFLDGVTAPKATYSYDNMSRLTGVTDANELDVTKCSGSGPGSITWASGGTYNPAGQLTAVSRLQAPGHRTVKRSDGSEYPILHKYRSRYRFYYFYLRGEVLGAVIVRIGRFIPFEGSYLLNGHSYNLQLVAGLEKTGFGQGCIHLWRVLREPLFSVDLATGKGARSRVPTAFSRPRGWGSADVVQAAFDRASSKLNAN
jgi:hypothetical protein